MSVVDKICRVLDATPAPSPEQRARLAALADFLDSRDLAAALPGVAELPKFDMRALFISWNFNEDSLRGRDPQEARDHSCGAIACALGHAALLFPALPGEDWTEFEERVLGTCSAQVGWEETSVWIFSGNWDSVDPTPEGAAARIRWYLEHGVPENSHDQMRGLAPLCYVPHSAAGEDRP